MAVDPKSLAIVQYPAEILRTRCRPVPEVNDEVRAVARRMIELMFEAEGVGLAAPQVGLPWRLFVCHVPEDEERSVSAQPATATSKPEVYVNPVLTQPSPSLESASEGCLSLPEISGDVSRPGGITIEAIDMEGEPFSRVGAGLLARCWQHEVDHLDGVLIIDRMSHLSRLRMRSAVRGLERAAGLR